MGVVHGGMLATFMDAVLAMALRQIGRGGVTVNLSLDYLRMARTGDWVMGESRLLRATTDLAFVEGRAFVGQRDLVRASGVFKLMRRA
jgi:acyl-coenzyme A thioesterase PaaI-like protein